MVMRKTKYFGLLIIAFFLGISLSFSPLRAKEGMIKATVKKKPVENPQVQSSEEQPTISFDTTTYDAGEVWEGDTVSHSFSVKNTGTAVLNIKNVKPG